MRIHKEAIQAAAVKLTERAEECFDRAQDQHASADLQHANAEKLVVLGTALEADAAKLLGDTEVNKGPATAHAAVDAAAALKVLLVKPNLAA